MVRADRWRVEGAGAGEPDRADLRLRLERAGVLRRASLARGSASGSGRLGGVVVETSRGCFLLRRQEFPPGHRHGPWPLEQACRVPCRRLGLEGLDPRRALFLDAETTGLAGGTGTYAFLVGIAWFEEGWLRVEQLFMREHAEEAAMLEYLQRRLEACGGLVSFNGKRFDLQLLQTRYLMKRMGVDLEELPHLDLLHPARRLWGPGLPDCRLETLEARVLGKPRRGDVPGGVIPHLYFRYLRTGDEGGLVRVAEHNRRDLLALVGLAAGLACTLRDTFARRPPVEEAALGRMLVEMGEAEAGEALLERALERPLPWPARRGALLFLARRRRRRGDREGAARLWRAVLVEEPFHPEAVEGMAKHLEHRHGDYAAALRLVEGALSRRGLPPGRRRALEHRRRRLLRRLAVGS